MLFVLGASGAGKTAAVQSLAASRLPGVHCYHFDDIGVPSAEVMEREWGGGERWQERMTKQWIQRLVSNSDGAEVAVLEGQTRPSFIQPELTRRGVRHSRIVLLDCPPLKRMIRLHGPRNQPELSNERMDAWAAYLRGQADALGLPVIDTGLRSLQEVVAVLEEQVRSLRTASGEPARR